MLNNIQQKTELISGWGRIRSIQSSILLPHNEEQVSEIIKCSDYSSIIPRGLGRSYGDAAQCCVGKVLDLRNLNKISLNKDSASVTVGAGVSLDELLKYIVNKGFFLPVSPGTKYVTIGGAISSDVHGKNHHCEGSFANHVEEITIINGTGEKIKLSPFNAKTRTAFWATAGGMGLTGVILEAKFKLIPISSSLISVNTIRFLNLESLMEEMIKGDEKYRYSVAWIDSLHKNGRGVLTRGDHANIESIESQSNIEDPFFYDPKQIGNTPSFLPGGLLNNWTVKAFNEAWYRKSPSFKEDELQTINTFFHPLDGIKNWNKIYGPKGFLQYQFVVPDEGAYMIRKTLNKLKDIGAPSFLTVLKRFGEENSGLLSFPFKGWTLAADVPAGVQGLYETLNELDNDLIDAGGRIYLAKDSRQSASTFSASYPQLNEWLNEKEKLDPNHIFCSDLSKRLKL